MGYISSLEGEMEFSRPLTRKESAPLALAFEDNWNVFELITETETRETDEGELTVTKTYGVGLSMSSAKAYEMARVLQEAITALPEDVKVTGYFERVGEEQPDMERLYVVGRKVVVVQARITWDIPEGAQV